MKGKDGDAEGWDEEGWDKEGWEEEGWDEELVGMRKVGK